MISFCFFSAFLFSASEEPFYIMECWRQMYSSRSVQQASEKTKIAPPFHPSHCYVVFANGAKIIDSRGFYDTGPQKEPPEKIEISKCSVVREYSRKLSSEARADWLRFTDRFDIQEKYSPTEMNCCSRCVEAFRSIGCKTRLESEFANLGIGTRWRTSQSAVQNALTGDANDD